MWLIDSLAEEQIQAAERRGEFENLPGHGRPLALEDEALVPESLRAGYRLLKNAGCLPPDLMLRNEIREIESLLHQAQTVEESSSCRRRLDCLRARLAIAGHDCSPLWQESAYRERLLRRLDDGSSA